MTFRQFVLLTHRWLGIGSSLVLLLVGVTGGVLIWPESLGTAEKSTERFHTRLSIGEPGEWLVITATAIAAFLVLGGLVLWWKRRLLRVNLRRGAWRFLFDLHHSLGFFAAVVMLLLSLTGLGLVLTEHEDGSPLSPGEQRVRDTVTRLHTGREFALPLKLIYLVGSVAFAVQGLSGVVMWWKPQVDRAT
jgi:uncharacterized iron-regulated membrane protein